MRFRILAVFVLVPLLAFAQADTQQQQIQARPSAAGEQPEKPKPSKEQLERGHQMLERAEASANGMEGGMRAYGLLQVANAYALTDKQKAMSLLDEALAATHVLDSDDSQKRTRDDLQEEILRAMVPLDPTKADSLLDQLDAPTRGSVLNALLDHFAKENDWDRAIGIIYRIAPEQEVPYAAVGNIMKKLPDERSGDRVQLFSTALTSYKDHSASAGSMAFGGSDFPSLILSTWKTLPRETVLEAINAVLDGSKKPAQDSSGQPQPLAVSMASANGAVEFNSVYEFRLFQLLPVLKQLDASKADELLKQDQAVKAALNQYPEGMRSISPNSNGPGQGGQGAMTSMMVGPPRGTNPGGGPQRGPASPALMQVVAKILQDAAKHPDEALANAGSIPDPRMRVQAFMGIARASAKEHASVAREALEKVVEGMADLPLTQQTMMVGDVAGLYLQMGDTDSAKKVIENGMTLAEKAYKEDTNADDPNKALEAYWPSAAAYRSLLRLAAKISPTWSLDLLKNISDPNMKGIGQIALAQAWLDVSPGATTIITQSKYKNMEMKTLSQ